MTVFRNFLEERKRRYLTELRAIDPDGMGIFLLCPACKLESWVLLPSENIYFIDTLDICCPAACGHYASLNDFSPCASGEIIDFDEEHICPIDKAKFRTFGVIHRCPVCAIENPREVMNACADRVLASTSSKFSDLADQLSSLVSTFDGVMRRSNRIAQKNASLFGNTHPHIKSFQDAATAQKILAPLLDISVHAKDWQEFMENFQKRHSLSHSLGIIDKKYVDKTAASPLMIGRKIGLSKSQVDQFAEDCKAIVRVYFGYFLF